MIYRKRIALVMRNKLYFIVKICTVKKAFSFIRSI